MSKSRSGAPRRVAAGLLAGSLAIFGLAFAPPAGATADATVDRTAGATRYGTAAAVSTEAYSAGSDCVLIATGEGFADALAASGLAGADGCPILLVQQDAIPEETSAAIDDLGASSATIVGGTAAVSQDVEDALSSELGLTVDRVAGTDRYETAGEVANAIGSSSGTVLVASGEVAPDALSLGPIAANLGAPILLVTTDGLPSATSDGLAGATEVLIAGGTARISDDNQAAIEDASDDADGADRLAGTNRQETSVEVANYEVDTLGWGPTTALLAAPSAPSSDFSPDALVAGPLGGLREAPVLIVTDENSLGPAGDFLDLHSDTIDEVFLVGGTAVLSDEIFTAAETAAQNTDNDEATGDVSLTGAPELTSVTFKNLTSTGGSAGLGQLLVTAHFDEDVLSTPILQSGFKLYTPYGAGPSATFQAGEVQTSTSAQQNADDPSAVDVVFDVFAGGSLGAVEGTLATVTANTVQDADGHVNPEGEASGLITQTFAAGTTRNPDLTSVAVATANTQYDFTFDLGVQILTPTGFRIVDTDGVERTATTSSIVAGTATANTVVRATFPAPTGSATGVRGTVIGGATAIASTAAATTPQESVDITGASTTNSDAPDLVSISLDTTLDQVTFTFDEVIDTLDGVTGLRTGFHVYYRQFGGSGLKSDSNGATDKSSSDPRSVIAQFPTDTINEYVAGAWVGTGAVQRSGAVVTGKTDSAGVGHTFPPDAPGNYLGPQLTSATVADTSNVFGTVTGRKVTFVFDQPLASPITNTSGFFVTDANGARTNLAGCTLGTSTSSTPNNSTVTCAVAATTGAQFTAMGTSVLATVLSGSVTSVARHAIANGTVPQVLFNHEERAAASGPAA